MLLSLRTPQGSCLRAHSRHGASIHLRCCSHHTTTCMAQRAKIKSLPSQEGRTLRSPGARAVDRPDIQDRTKQEEDNLTGQVCLLAVTFLWGTYSPAVRLIFSQPGSPSPEVLTAVRAVLQALALLATAVVVPLLLGSPGRLLSAQSSRLQKTARASSYSGSPAGKRSKPGSPSQRARQFLGGLLPESVDPAAVAGGLELGLWNFCGSGLQAVGLEHTGATRAAFLIQATTLITPVLASIAGNRPPVQVWIGCCIAMAGTVLITIDHTAGDAASSQTLSLQGDLSLLGAAFFYSLSTVRLGERAARAPVLQLAAAKSTALAVYAVAWLGGTILLRGQASLEGLRALWPNAGGAQQWGALAWTATASGALAAFLQTQGQSRVPPAQAQVLYSTTPLWSALLAWLLLSNSEEAMSAVGWSGGLALVAASLVASRPTRTT